MAKGSNPSVAALKNEGMGRIFGVPGNVERCKQPWRRPTGG